MGACSAPGCLSYREAGQIQFKRFPRDPKRRAVWASKVNRVGWVPNDNSYLCERHFNADQWEKIFYDGPRKLKPTAVPTIFPVAPLRKAAKCNILHDHGYSISDARKKEVNKRPVILSNENLLCNRDLEPKGTEEYSVPKEERLVSVSNVEQESTVFVRFDHSYCNNVEEPGGIADVQHERETQNLQQPNNAEEPSRTVEKIPIIKQEESTCTLQQPVDVMKFISPPQNEQLVSYQHEESSKNIEPIIDHLKSQISVSTTGGSAIAFHHQNVEEMDSIQTKSVVGSSDAQCILDLSDKNVSNQSPTLKLSCIDPSPFKDTTTSNVPVAASTASIESKSSKGKYQKPCCEHEVKVKIAERVIKQNFDLKRKLTAAMRRIKILERNRQIYDERVKEVLHKDQIERLLSGSSRGRKWSKATLNKAVEVYRVHGKKGYDLVSTLQPLPTLRTLQRYLQSLRKTQEHSSVINSVPNQDYELYGSEETCLRIEKTFTLQPVL